MNTDSIDSGSSGEGGRRVKIHRERSSRQIAKRMLSTRTLDSVDSADEAKVQEDIKVLTFEFIRLQEYVESMNKELAKAGVMDSPSEEPKKDLLKKTSILVSSMVDKSLYKSFGWKGALAITGSILLLHVAFITIYTRFAVTHGCMTEVQLLDSKMWDAARSKDGHTRHICSMEMLSMRSEMFTKEGLDILDAMKLPEDRECHLNQISHALVKEQSDRYPGFPTLIAHDFAKAEWYPCMFEGMTCHDIASMDICGPMDLLTQACEKGWITDATSKFKNPNAPAREPVGPYQCDTTQHPEGAEESLEYKFAHFGKCAGLVSTVFNDCPDVGTTLGAAEGLAAIISFLISMVVVAPLTLYWQYRNGGANNPTVLAEGMVDL